ncbi:MAG TPA: biopolymer transporter ExbD [Pirellulaceae bacterium]|nr:biopolymer transporter ExbD [Pirellulaceae bacterium]
MPLKTHQEDIPQINLTPMLDIVFNLIIFFMVAARFSELEERNIDVKVPQVKTSAQLSDVPKKRTINVLKDGQITLDSRPVTLPQLTAELTESRRLRPDMSVVVRGDAQGTFQNVASVLTACREAGVNDMGISVRMEVKQR